MCEADFRIALSKCNVYIYKLNILLGFKHGEALHNLNQCDRYVKF